MVKKWLRKEKRKWLLVLDSLDDDGVLKLRQETGTAGASQTRRQQPVSLLDFLPQTPNGSLLLTTRTTSVAHQLAEPRDCISVDPMIPTEAVALLAKKLDGDPDDRDLHSLAGLLEFMPLALVQAAAYIQKRTPRCSVREYINKFVKNDQAQTGLLDHEAGYLRRDHEAKNSIIVTWQISFDYIRARWPSSADLLSLMSFFDRQGIPDYVLTQKCQRDGEDSASQRTSKHASSEIDRDTFDMNVERLRDYSFISVELDGHTFAMHRLMQLATRDWLARQGQDKQHQATFLKKLNMCFPSAEHKNWAQCKALFPHITAAEAQRPDRTENNDSLHDWGWLMYAASEYALEQGRLVEAERMCIMSINALEEDGREDKIHLSYVQERLATIYRRRGRWKEAEELQMKVLETHRTLRGDNHYETAQAAANLASIYYRQDRLEEAEKLLLQALEVNKGALGENHLDTLADMNDLARIREGQGRWEEAEELYMTVIKTQKHVLGDEHPRTLTSMGNLGLLYDEMHRLEEAERMQLDVIEVSKRVIGEEHIDTSIRMSNLALTYSKQGRFKEAVDIDARVLEARKRVLGEEHPRTLSSMHNLACDLAEQQRFHEAIALLTVCERLKIKTRGATHPSTKKTTAWLADCQRELARQGQDQPSVSTQGSRKRARSLSIECSNKR